MWTPKTVGENFAFSPTMKALEPFRNNVNVFSGLAQVTGRALGDGPGDHARRRRHSSPACIRTRPGAPISSWGFPPTRSPPKRLEGSRSCRRSSSVSNLSRSPAIAIRATPARTCRCRGAAATSPLPAEVNPRAVFERLFGDGESTDPAARMARLKDQKSVLDYVTDSLSRLQRRVGIGDKRKLDEYLESVRDIERRIQLAEEQSLTIQLPHMERPRSAPDDYKRYATLMMDLQVIAWQTDMTRVASFMLGRDASNRPYREIGISDGHHGLSHHQGVSDRIDKLIKIDELHVAMFAYLLKRLQETQDGDGTLLDHSLIVFGSSLSESNIHTHDDLPIVLAGNANGQVKGNRHLVYPKETPLNNLFLTMFDAAGLAPVTQFGDSTGRLTGV